MEEVDLYGKLALELMDARSDQIRLGVDHQETRDLGGEVFAHRLPAASQARESRPCHPKDISLRMGVTSARVATILKRLERRGLLTRRIDRQDARQTVVELTEEGSAFILRHRRAVKERFARTLRALGHEDAAELVRIGERGMFFVVGVAEMCAADLGPGRAFADGRGCRKRGGRRRRCNKTVPSRQRLIGGRELSMEIEGCTGIMVRGHRVRSFAYSTDVAVIHNTNADAILAVYPLHRGIP